MSGKESLGWLTESAIQPRKAKPIQIDQSSVLNLKATLFETEEDLKTSADGSGRRIARSSATSSKLGSLGSKNKGVLERDRKAAEQEQLEQIQRQQKMREKVEMYQKLGMSLMMLS